MRLCVCGAVVSHCAPFFKRGKKKMNAHCKDERYNSQINDFFFIKGGRSGCILSRDRMSISLPCRFPSMLLIICRCVGGARGVGRNHELKARRSFGEPVFCTDGDLRRRTIDGESEELLP